MSDTHFATKNIIRSFRMSHKRVRTFFEGEGALPVKRKKLTKEEWDALQVQFPDGLPHKRRNSDGPPQRSLCVYSIRKSTTQSQVHGLLHEALAE